MPIVQTSTFALASSAEMHRYLEGDDELYLYTRYANPTLREVEERLAALEGAESALVLASGMAAMSSALLSIVSLTFRHPRRVNRRRVGSATLQESRDASAGRVRGTGEQRC